MKIYPTAALVHWIKAHLFILVLSLMGVLTQLQYPCPVLAQKEEKEQLEDQRVPASEAAPPKARLYSVKSNPTNSFKIYSATSQGLKVSEDGGLSWEPLPVGGKHHEVFAFAVHPTNPTLFAGRRDGLWKSKDGGLSWSPMPYPASVPLSVAIAKNEPNVLYLAPILSYAQRPN